MFSVAYSAAHTQWATHIRTAALAHKAPALLVVSSPALDAVSSATFAALHFQMATAPGTVHGGRLWTNYSAPPPPRRCIALDAPRPPPSLNCQWHQPRWRLSILLLPLVCKRMHIVYCLKQCTRVPVSAVQAHYRGPGAGHSHCSGRLSHWH